VLRSAFAQAQRWGWVWDNPVALAHRIVVPPRELRPPTPAELRELLEHIGANDAMFHAFVLLAAITGARRSQLLGLRWEDVNHSMMRVSFRSGWVEGPDGPTLAATKTRRSHSVDLDPHSYRSLIALTSDSQCCGFVFSDDGGVTAWKPNRVTKNLVRYRRAAGVPEFRLHDLRTSWRPRCSTPVFRCRWCHVGWTTSEPRRRSTSTPTQSPDARHQPPNCYIAPFTIRFTTAAELTESMHDLTALE
jgi:integrase